MEMEDQQRIYNSRIIKIYLEYTRKTYPNLDTDSLLQAAGITPYEVEDQAHWFTQTQVDRFYDALVIRTGNQFIAREAGRYSISSESLGPRKQIALSFMSPSTLYLLMEKMHSIWSRGASLKARKMGSSKVEIIAIPNPGVHERENQCQNRMGTFESAAKLFTNTFANIEHPECFHKGDGRCVYIITWETSPVVALKRIGYYLVGACVPASFLFFFLFPFKTWGVMVLSMALLCTLWALLTDSFEKKELKKTIQAQGEAGKDHIASLNTRYTHALLVQEIGQATSTILDIDELLKSVAEAIARHLDFDRGLVMLGQEDKLVYRAGFGYGNMEEGFLQGTEFNLRNPMGRGVFIRAYREQKPFLIGDIKDEKESISKKSFELAEKVGAKSLICVPLVYKKESLGILAVDNIKTKRQLTQSDVNLLMGVASQAAVSIVNAMSFKKLQESEKKYRDLVENAHSIIMRIDREGVISFFNEYARRFFGYREDEVLGKNVVGIIFPDKKKSIETVKELIKRFLRDPGRPFVTETENILRNGQPVWIAWTYKPILESENYFREVLCIGNNITELKQAEQEKRNLEARLQRAQKMEAIGTLAGGVAHDLNNILSGLVSYPELLLMDIPESSPLRKPILTIQKSGERAAMIVQDLLTLARRGVAVTEITNLNRIITEYLKSPEFEKLIEHHSDVWVSTELEQESLNILGSPVHLSKTIMNLVTNAAEAMPKGGEILIKTENTYVDRPIRGYESVEKGDYVVLYVSDKGIGISESDRERIFEPFYTKKVMGRSGTGLGMAVVWGTVKDHNGYIDLQSEVNKGTTFKLYFPVTRKDLIEKTSSVPMENLMSEGKFILVVDDVDDQREIATTMLKKLGYEADSVSSGEEAVEYLRTHSVDLLVMDMIMDPGIDGLETYQRALQINPKQKAIIASGFSESERVKKAQGLGAGAYLKKPYLMEKLGLAVKEELERQTR